MFRWEEFQKAAITLTYIYCSYNKYNIEFLLQVRADCQHIYFVDALSNKEIP